MRQKMLWTTGILATLIIIWHVYSGYSPQKVAYRDAKHSENQSKVKLLLNENVLDDQDQLSSKEEERLTRLMDSWPAFKPKALIYYLADANRFNRPRMLIQSLQSLQQHFLRYFIYPVVVFHEENFKPEIPRVRREAGVRHLYFILVRFEIPSFLTDSVPEMSPCTGRHPVGYRHMCRFHAKTVYEQNVLRAVDYVLRLDDDSFFTGHVTFDLFQDFAYRRYIYGYILSTIVYEPCVVGLDSALVSYFKQRHNLSHSFNINNKNSIFYNNFELSKMSFWKSQEYQDFIEYIDRLGGIYYHRWGDAPIKTKAIYHLLYPQQVYQMKNISYAHAGRRTF